MSDLKNEQKPERLNDILIFMSDQHTPYYSGFYGSRCADTPNLNWHKRPVPFAYPPWHTYNSMSLASYLPPYVL